MRKALEWLKRLLESAGRPAATSPAGIADESTGSEGLIDKVVRECRLYGQALARDRDDLTAEPEIIKRLDPYGRDQIARAWLGPIDIGNNPADRQLEEDLDNAARRLLTVQDGISRAETGMNRTIAANPAFEPAPRPSFLILMACVAAYAFGVGASFITMPPFPAMALDDPVLAALMTYGMGVIFGTIAVATMFGLEAYPKGGGPQLPDEPETTSWSTTAGGLMIAGVGAVRAAAAATFADWMLVGALVLLDASCLAYSKVEGTRFRARLKKYREKQAGWPQREKDENDMAALLEQEEAKRAPAVAEYEAARRKWEARLERSFDLETMQDQAARATVEGYLRQIDLNTGRHAAGRREELAS